MKLLAVGLVPVAAAVIAVAAVVPGSPAPAPTSAATLPAGHAPAGSATGPELRAAAAPWPGQPLARRPVGSSARVAPAPLAVRRDAQWLWPLHPRPPVLHPFVRPASTWGAGHRGVDLGATVGEPVRAVAAGMVSHVGVVAGRPTLTIAHSGGLRSTYEPVTAVVRAGQLVAAGQVVGHVVAQGSHCVPGACLHLGALRGKEYLDPLTLLTATRVRLLPLWR